MAHCDDIRPTVITNYCTHNIYFFNVGTPSGVPPSGVHLFDHLLWPMFQSSIFLHIYIIQSTMFHTLQQLQ